MFLTYKSHIPLDRPGGNGSLKGKVMVDCNKQAAFKMVC
jgi:hypothetical protein